MTDTRFKKGQRVRIIGHETIIENTVGTIIDIDTTSDMTIYTVDCNTEHNWRLAEKFLEPERRTLEERAIKFATRNYINSDGEIVASIVDAETKATAMIVGETIKAETIDDICNWLKYNWRNYIDTDADGMIRFSGWEKDLRNAII